MTQHSPALTLGMLGSTQERHATSLVDGAMSLAPTDVGEVLKWCVQTAGELPRAGEGSTAELWECLATVSAIDVGIARMLEPHVDALNILHQAGDPNLSAIGVSDLSSWGVFAAEAPGARVEARERPNGWTLSGTKAWCSLAGDLSHALVTAFVGANDRVLFAIDLRDAGVTVHGGPWVARGLHQVRSTPISLADVPAVPIAPPDWYTGRSGFQWGGMGVAACWWGGAVGVGRTLFDRLRATRQLDPLLALHAGEADVELASVQAVLGVAAAAIDGADLTTGELSVLAKRVRAAAFTSAEAILKHSAHALGPSPLVEDEGHARRVADLDIYIRQHHAEKDSVSLGKQLHAFGAPAW